MPELDERKFDPQRAVDAVHGQEEKAWRTKESNPLNHGVGAKQCMGLLNRSRA